LDTGTLPIEHGILRRRLLQGKGPFQSSSRMARFMHRNKFHEVFKEVLMNIAATLLLSLWVAAAAPAQTQDLGQGIFYSDQGAIVMAVNAAVADLKLDKPYLMFMVYMGTNGNESITVTRDDVAMVYNGKEYKMPTVQELNGNYHGEQNDWELYQRAGKESLVLSKMRYWRYQTGTDFFPLPSKSIMGVNQGSLAGTLGFRTRLYFKNPGLKKGDEIVIVVRDHKNPDITGSCAVKFE
jgi:hypothetical protein